MAGIGCANSAPRGKRSAHSRGTQGSPLSTGCRPRRADATGDGRPGPSACALGDAPEVIIAQTAPAPPAWLWPLADTRIVHAFRPPATTYGIGHRGIDLAAERGQSVHAVAGGVVSFVGEVAGVPVVSVDHGHLRSTYQPVKASVRTGERIDAGTPIGSVASAGEHCPDACLHLGARIGDDYLDPMRLLTTRRVVLKPLHPTAVPRADGPG